MDEGLGGAILGYRRLEIGTTEHLIQWDEGTLTVMSLNIYMRVMCTHIHIL